MPEETNNPINDLIQAVDENTTETNTILEHSLEQGVRTGKIVEAHLETADKTYSEIKKMSDKKMAIEIEIDGAETIMYKGEKGDKGDKGDTPSDEVLKKLIKPLIPEPIKGEDGRTPTEEELISLIEPLIPEPIKGEDGSNYILSDQDKQDIADSIEVPVVEKVIEKVQVIKEVPKKEKPEELKKKIESLGIDYEKLSNTPDIETMMNVVRKTSSKTVSLVELDDVDLSGVTITNGKYVLGSGGGGGTWGSITGTLSNQTDLQTALNAKLSTSTAATTYVPYSGATSNINIGVRKLILDDFASSGYYTEIYQDVTYGFTIDDEVGLYGLRNRTSGFTTFFSNAVTANRSYTLPDASGTIALTTSFSGTYVPYTGATADVSLGAQALQFGGSYRTTITYDNANEATLILSDNVATTGKIGFGTYGAGYRVYTQGTNISATRTLEYPNANGTFVISVNGTTPDTAGNVVISSGALTVGSTSVASGTTTRILYNNAGTLGEYTLTGTGTVVAMQTAPTFATSITTPSVLATANDSGALGASGTAFSDLFLASGAVINFNAGNVTITHSAGTLTFNSIAIALGSGAITTTGNVTANSFLGLGSVRAGVSSLIYWNGSTQMKSPSDGVITMWDNANTSFNRLQFGGTTSSFPSIKRSSAILQARLADDSAYTDIEVADEVYGAGWNGSLEVPTKNAVYDKIETVIAGAGANTALSNLASVAINTTLVSDTNNTDDLGTTAVKWANLYVTNIGATATRTTNGWFTDIESTNMPTVGGVALLTSLTAPQFTTIELGHATDTTISRVSAGVIAVEGVTLLDTTKISDTAYDSTWNSVTTIAPSKNAIFDANFAQTQYIDIARGLGSAMLFRSFGSDRMASTGMTMVDGRAHFMAIYITQPTTITGVKWFQETAGNYTADNNNYIALYSYSGGTLTQVAISANDGNIWKATGNTIASAAFTSTYAAERGVYFIALLWNASATTTAPVISVSDALASNNQAIMDFTNSAKITGTISSQTALPSPTQAISGVTVTNVLPWLALY